MTQMNVTRERRKIAIQSAKQGGWSHQHDLKDLVGKKIEVGLLGCSITGKLVAADQFSLKLELDLPAFSAPKFAVYFKSAVTYFSEVQG